MYLIFFGDVGRISPYHTKQKLSFDPAIVHILHTDIFGEAGNIS